MVKLGKHRVQGERSIRRLHAGNWPSYRAIPVQQNRRHPYLMMARISHLEANAQHQRLSLRIAADGHRFDATDRWRCATWRLGRIRPAMVEDGERRPFNLHRPLLAIRP